MSMEDFSRYHIEKTNTVRVLEDQFNIFYANAIIAMIDVIAHKHCDGCLTSHLSQTHHSCITLSINEKLEKLFPMTIHSVNENEILCQWEKSIESMNIDVNVFETYKKNLTSSKWRETHLKTSLWENKIFNMVKRMLFLEFRFV